MISCVINILVIVVVRNFICVVYVREFVRNVVVVGCGVVGGKSSR